VRASGDGVRVYLDEGGGISDLSLKRLAYLIKSGLIGDPIYAWCIQAFGYNFHLFSNRIEDDPYSGTSVHVLLSGLNCGYGGEGPRALVQALKRLGLPVNAEEAELIFTSPHIYANFQTKTITTLFPPTRVVLKDSKNVVETPVV